MKNEKSILTILSKKRVKAAMKIPYHFTNKSRNEGD